MLKKNFDIGSNGFDIGSNGFILQNSHSKYWMAAFAYRHWVLNFSRKLPVISQANHINYISDVHQSAANNIEFPILVKPKSPGLVNF